MYHAQIFAVLSAKDPFLDRMTVRMADSQRQDDRDWQILLYLWHVKTFSKQGILDHRCFFRHW